MIPNSYSKRSSYSLRCCSISSGLKYCFKRSSSPALAQLVKCSSIGILFGVGKFGKCGLFNSIVTLHLREIDAALSMTNGMSLNNSRISASVLKYWLLFSSIL